MSDLFVLLLLLSIICLIAGLVKPTWFSKLFKGNATRKKVGFTFLGTTVLFFILLGITAPKVVVVRKKSVAISNVQNKPPQQQMPPAQATPTAKPVSTSQAAPAPVDPQQQLEDSIKTAISNYKGGTPMSYKDLQVQNADADRPAGTKSVIVSVDTGETFSKNTLVNDTSTLASSLYQTVFQSNINGYDVFVWYYGQTKDQYGNSGDNELIIYGMDKDTYTKINWSGFDATNLCTFLKDQGNTEGDSGSDACNIVANIE
jgi:hypothetical protein